MSFKAVMLTQLHNILPLQGSTAGGRRDTQFFIDSIGVANTDYWKISSRTVYIRVNRITA